MKTTFNLEHNYYLLSIIYEMNSMAEEWTWNNSTKVATYKERSKGKMGAVAQILIQENIPFNPIEILDSENNIIGYGIDCAGNLWTLFGIDNDLELHRALTNEHQSLTLKNISSSELILEEKEWPSEYYWQQIKEIIQKFKKTSINVSEITHLCLKTEFSNHHLMAMLLWPKQINLVEDWANNLIQKNNPLKFHINKIKDGEHSEEQLEKIKKFIKKAELELNDKVNNSTKRVEDYSLILETAEYQNLLGFVHQNKVVKQLLKKSDFIKNISSSLSTSIKTDYSLLFLTNFDEPNLIKFNSEKINPNDFLEVLNHVTLLQNIEKVAYESDWLYFEPPFKKIALTNSKAYLNLGYQEDNYQHEIENETIFCNGTTIKISDLQFIKELPQKMNEICLMEKISINNLSPIKIKRF